MQVRPDQDQQLSASRFTSASTSGADCAPSTAAEPGGAQASGLKGFLTPLGRLAGMFGWTPGTSVEHMSALPLPGGVTTAGADVDRHFLSRPIARQQLAHLARPANTSAGETHTLPPNTLQLRPEELTLNQLQNLQKAAELLSPKSTFMQQAEVLPASNNSNSIAGAHAETVNANQPRPKPDISKVQQGSWQRSSQRASPSGRDKDQAHITLCPAEEPAAQPDADCMSQYEDDALAAALGSRLASMAPHISSLYTDTLTDWPVRHLGCLSITARQACDGVCKRKRDEEADALQGAHDLYSNRPESSYSLTEQQIVNASGSLHLHAAGFKHTRPAADACANVASSNQDVHSPSLQLGPRKMPTQLHKKFKKTTGIEVLYRCMPSLWQTTG